MRIIGVPIVQALIGILWVLLWGVSVSFLVSQVGSGLRLGQGVEEVGWLEFFFGQILGEHGLGGMFLDILGVYMGKVYNYPSKVYNYPS